MRNREERGRRDREREIIKTLIAENKTKTKRLRRKRESRKSSGTKAK